MLGELCYGYPLGGPTRTDGLVRQLPDGAEQCTITFFFEHFNRLIRQSSASFLESVEAGIKVDSVAALVDNLSNVARVI